MSCSENNKYVLSEEDQVILRKINSLISMSWGM